MALRATPTIAICLAAGVAAGTALARPGDEPESTTSPPVAEPAGAAPSADATGDPDSPYLVDGAAPPEAADDAVSTTAPTPITIEGFAFSSTAPIAAGSPIAVTNLDGAEHTLTARDGAFDTGTLAQNDVGLIAAPTAPGTYEFFCVIHPSMTGQLVVT